MTDSLGRKISFKNTIIIMTSNIGARQLSEFGQGIGFNTRSKKDENTHSKSVIQKALKRAFSPEFLNRIDDIVLFNKLEKEDINHIIDIEMNSLLARINTLGYTVKISKKAKNFIAEKGFDTKFGARPLKRAVQKYFEDPLSEEIINATIKEGDTIKVDLNKDKTELVIRIARSDKKEKKRNKIKKEE
tara:strand:- start:15 stop:578 length:564 start_codon:yes stop_codon:yes gene_type:complete